jgi:Phosphotransferase enzyme family
MPKTEHPLTGGNLTHRVVRIDDTVRKPATAATPSIEAFLTHLNAAGFSAAPKTLGRDGLNRHVTEYIPGKLRSTLPPMTHLELTRIGRLIREFHDISESFIPPGDAQWNVAIPPDREDLIIHHDLAPWNLIQNGDRWVFIDWDNSGPGSRLWDLAYAAIGFVPFESKGLPSRDTPRLRALVDGYAFNREQREQLPQLIVSRARSMHALLVEGHRTGQQPWSRLYDEGHANYWGPAADYIEQHLDVWTKALK